ncbi:MULTISPECIES: thioredoxin family protein [Microbacterium]|uniref:thioredoxin family protein n=1 Tax=Microbacterium TaxID=33882 RepID=UPI00217D33C5|nr:MULTISPECIES: thioredoxin family protein [Microbacterium]UWF78299.1 thioredoxin family protein [Microbacterium neungamense]WCM56475.1 thioredoxin family protein [Microbacterium sp. EF45047]
MRIATCLVVVVLSLGLSGCAGAAPPGADDPVPSATASASPSDTPSGSGQPSASETPPQPGAEDTAAPAPGVYRDYDDGAIEAVSGTKVLFFHASWCPQCRALDEELRSAGVPDGMTVFKVDYDDRVDLRQKYGVTRQTTVVYVDDEGRKLSSAVLYDDPSIASLLAAAP